MASVVVRVDDLKRGDLPAICAKTGVPCRNAVALKLRVSGTGTLGPLITERRLGVVLPMVPKRTALVRRLGVASWVAFLAFVAGILWAIDRGGNAAAALTLLALVSYVTLVVLGSRLWVGATVAYDRHAVKLLRVHPQFARAVGEQSQASR